MCELQLNVCTYMLVQSIQSSTTKWDMYEQAVYFLLRSAAHLGLMPLHSSTQCSLPAAAANAAAAAGGGSDTPPAPVTSAPAATTSRTHCSSLRLLSLLSP